MSVEAASSSKTIIPVYQLVPLRLWVFFNFDFLFAITHTQLITIPVQPWLGSLDTLNTSGWGDFGVSVKRRLHFPKPTAYFSMSLSTDYSLIFEHQQPVTGDIFLDLLYNCKPEWLCKQNHNNILIQSLTCKNRNCLCRHWPTVWVRPHWYVTDYLNLHSYWPFLHDKYNIAAYIHSGLACGFKSTPRTSDTKLIRSREYYSVTIVAKNDKTFIYSYCHRLPHLTK